MKKNQLYVAVMLCLQIFWPAQSLAADAVVPRLKEELLKQEQIYQGRGEQRLEGYVIDRSLLSYIYTLSAGFDRALAKLGAKERWLDIGAGRGQAVLDYFAGRFDAMNVDLGEKRGEKAQVVAVSIEDRTTALWHQAAANLAPGQMRYLAGKRLREYAPGELGRFQLITDVIGGFSYSTDLALFVERVFSLLEVNGSFYTVLQDIHAEGGTNKPYYADKPSYTGARYLTEITKADGSEVRVCSWLKSITCAQVTCELKAGWQPPIEVFHMRKVCDDVKVPVLSAVRYEAGTPPEREFRLAN